MLYFISLSAHKEIKYLGNYLTRLCGTTFGSTLWDVRAPCRENGSIYWSFLTVSHMEKPQCNRFQIQIRSTCVSCSHMATNLRKQQFVSPSHCTTSNFRKEKKNQLCGRQMVEVALGWVGLCWVGSGWGLGVRRLVQSWAESRLAWVRQFQVPVIRSSQPNNLKLPTSHGSSRDPLNLLKADGVAETWENTSRVRHD